MPELHPKISDTGLETLLQAINRTYRYDFSGYSKESIKRRINRFMDMDRIPDIATLEHALNSQSAYFERFVEEITVNVTDMFRNPTFFKALQDEVFPILKKIPFIRIWHAGCATGEEVYSMAILLNEAGLLERSLLYGTDLNPKVLETAKNGIYPLNYIKTYSENYIQSGGTKSLSNYFTLKYNQVLFNEDLRQRMVYSVHNLVTDQSFNEFHLILCRNVLIYFQQGLQIKVIDLFSRSLSPEGILALGSKESIHNYPRKDDFIFLNKTERIMVKKVK